MAQAQQIAAPGSTAFIAKNGDVYSCVVDGKQVGRSKHQDYFTYHYGRHDIKSLAALTISQFVYLNDAGDITYVVAPGAFPTPGAVLRRQAMKAAALAA